MFDWKRFTLTVVRIVCLIPQAIGVAYAALLGWFLGAWMADDSWAARASDADWWMVAGQRIAMGFLGAALIGGVLLAANHALSRRGLSFPALRPARVALAGAAAVGLACIHGAITFAVERPFI